MDFRNPIVPLLATGWWDSYDYPSRILDQHFGMGLTDNDLLPSSLYRGYILRPRTRCNMDSSGESEVSNEPDNFKVMLNVSQFEPSDIDVKTVDNFIVVHGKHEERSDEHGFISREFTRRYMLPEGTEPETVKSSWSQNGVLKIEAPKKVQQPPAIRERVVPIILETASDK